MHDGVPTPTIKLITNWLKLWGLIRSNSTLTGPVDMCTYKVLPACTLYFLALHCRNMAKIEVWILHACKILYHLSYLSMYFPCRRSGKELEMVYDDNWQSFPSWVHRHQRETGQVTSNGTQQYRVHWNMKHGSISHVLILHVYIYIDIYTLIPKGHPKKKRNDRIPNKHPFFRCFNCYCFFFRESIYITQPPGMGSDQERRWNCHLRVQNPLVVAGEVR